MVYEIVPVQSSLAPSRARNLGAVVAAALQAAARSPHTRRAYEHALGLFLQYLGEALGEGPLAIPVKEGRRTIWGFSGPSSVLRRIIPGHLDGFRSWREEMGDGPETVSLRTAAVLSFLRVAYRDWVIPDGVAQRLGIRPYVPKQKRDRKPVGRRLSPQEVQSLRAAVNVTTTKGKRDLLILDLMLFAGLRCEEVARLNLENIVQDGGRWWLVFTGKGQRTRKIKIHDVLYVSIARWLAATGRTIPGEGSLLWPVNKGDVPRPGRLAPSVINRLVAEYGAQAALAPLHGEQRLSPHDLRRTCARNAYENGASLLAIQRLLGHADVSTTMRYIGDDDNNGGAVDAVNYGPWS